MAQQEDPVICAKLSLHDTVEIVTGAIESARKSHILFAELGIEIEVMTRQIAEIRATARLNAEGKNEAERDAHTTRFMATDPGAMGAQIRLYELRRKSAAAYAQGEADRRTVRFYTALAQSTGELISKDMYQ